MNREQQKQHDRIPQIYRAGYRKAVEAGPSARKSAIRAKCLDCQCWQAAEVHNCQITACPLWPYRMGAKPQIAADALK